MGTSFRPAPHRLPAVLTDSTRPLASPSVERVCENCASPDDELEAVRRVYLSPDADGPPLAEVVEEVELWCFSCRSLYPHEATDAG